MQTHSLIFAVGLASLVIASLAQPRYLGYAAVASAIITFLWVYFALRRPGGHKGDLRYGGGLVLVVVVIGILYWLNSVTDQPERIEGRIAECVATTQRLTGDNRIVCSATIDGGSVVAFVSVGLLVPGTLVPIDRYSRQVIGYHYEYGRSR